MLACLETDGDQLFSEDSLGLRVCWFAALGNRGSLKNRSCSAPVGNCTLKPCSPQLQFLLTCLFPFAITGLVQLLGKLQLLKIICISAPAHVTPKDDPMG